MADLPDIRFNVAEPEGDELSYIAASMTGGHVSSSGPFCRRAADILQEETGAAEVLLTTSGTAALELSAMMLDIEPGDTVIVPDFAFVTTALAYARQGARLRFCDIEPRTLGLDPRHLETLLDDSVRAVVPIHYAGVACDLEGIQKVLADRPDVALVEDNAHGLFGRWRDQPLGSFGRFAALSFHETKNIVCGEGGALLVNDPADVDRARVIFDKGTNRRAFMLGQVDKYTWKDTGSSFGLADPLAAYLFGQLEQRDRIQAKRRRVHEWYAEALAPHTEDGSFIVPAVPADRDPAYHMFYVLLPDKPTRDAVLVGMRERGVTATFHYLPLHLSDAAPRFADGPSDCPVSADISGRLLRLPFYNNLTVDDARRVVAAFTDALADATRELGTSGR